MNQFIDANLVILTQDRPFHQEVLLGSQMGGPFRGYVMGPGGKNDGESSRRAAVKEVYEETGLVTFANELLHVGVLHSYRERTPWFKVDVFRAYRYGGTLKKTAAFRGDWQNVKMLPWERMVSTDQYWIFSALTGMWFGRISVYFGSTPDTFTRPAELEPYFNERLPHR